MHKNIMIVLIFSHLFSCLPKAHAQSEEPFIMTQQIITEAVDPYTCIDIIQQQATLTDTQSLESIEIVNQIDWIKQELNALAIEFEQLNQKIDYWQNSPEESLAYGNEQLAYVIETLYLDYQMDENFQLLSADEQLNLIYQHEVVNEWVNYINNLEALINQAASRRSSIEAEYHQLNYDLENYLILLEQDKINESQLNQCLLFPYSVPKYSVEDLWLNHQSTTLDEFLVQVDAILQKIVPVSYRKVAFSDIYRIYHHLFNQSTNEEFADKTRMEVDDYALQQYTYAKELSLKEIESIANKAYLMYLTSNNLAEFELSYQKMLSIKESQLTYWYPINQTLIDNLKIEFANYLNNNLLFDENAIQKVRTLHQRYQIKLVLYDESSQAWYPNDVVESGYYNEYYAMDLSNPQLPDSNQPLESQIDNSTEDQFSEEKSEADETIQDNEEVSHSESHVITDNLDYIKNQLANRQQESLSDISLPKPNSLSSQTQIQTADETGQNNKNHPITLPNTGEKRTLTTIALIILLIGMALLLVNLRMKRKQKEKIEEIDLD